jgi:putative addiction module CopG family antidote
MISGIPAEMSPFVSRMLAEGRFESESDVVLAGLRLLETKESLKDCLKQGIEDLDSGKVHDEEEVFAFVEEAIRQIESGK